VETYRNQVSSVSCLISASNTQHVEFGRVKGRRRRRRRRRATEQSELLGVSHVEKVSEKKF
jgi:hypothetical protein